MSSSKEEPSPLPLPENFIRLKEKVLEKKPVLREILEKRGDKNLFDYAKEYVSVNLNPPIKARQDELIGTIKNEVAIRLGDEVAQSVERQLEHYYYVSTIDHHGPLTHPFFINGNLMTSAPYFEDTDPILNNVIVLSCGNASLNNSSFPRGLLFHGYSDEKIVEHRLSFFPSSDRLCPIFDFHSYTSEDLSRVRKVLTTKVQNKEIPQDKAQQIFQILDEVYDQPNVLSAPSFSDQVTMTNFHLWKRFFGSISDKAPNLIYLEQENIVNKLLVKYHLYTDTTITHMLFDPAYDELFFKYFEGIQGAFSRQDKWGTYFFWGLPKGSKYRLQLWKKGNFLVSEDGTFKVELTPDSMKKAIEAHELIPSMMLSYILLSFYYGLKCLGGFSQVNYLTFMKNAYIKMQVDRGNYRSIEVCARSQTKEMGGDYTLAFLGGPKGEMVPATGIDFVLYGDDKTWPTFVEESKQITLDEAINPLMPEFYRIIYLASERDPDLLEITAEDITKMTKLDQKIKPCIFIS